MTVVTEHYGRRAKIGVIYMASSTVLEPEFYAMAPAGVSIHVSRIHLPIATVKGLAAMMKGDGVAVIDVREPHEYQTGHIPTATLIPVNSVFARREGVREVGERDIGRIVLI